MDPNASYSFNQNARQTSTSTNFDGSEDQALLEDFDIEAMFNPPPTNYSYGQSHLGHAAVTNMFDPNLNYDYMDFAAGDFGNTNPSSNSHVSEQGADTNFLRAGLTACDPFTYDQFNTAWSFNQSSVGVGSNLFPPSGPTRNLEISNYDFVDPNVLNQSVSDFGAFERANWTVGVVSEPAQCIQTPASFLPPTSPMLPHT